MPIIYSIRSSIGQLWNHAKGVNKCGSIDGILYNTTYVVYFLAALNRLSPIGIICELAEMAQNFLVLQIW